MRVRLTAAVGVLVAALTSCATSDHPLSSVVAAEVASIHRLHVAGADAPCVTAAREAIHLRLPGVQLVTRPEEADAILLISVSVNRAETFAPLQDGCESCRANRGELPVRLVVEQRVATADLLVPAGSGSYRRLLRVETGEGAATPLGKRIGEQFARTFLDANARKPSAETERGPS